MTLEIFNTIIGVASLLVAIFATSKTFQLQNRINTLNRTSGDNSPNQSISGNGNITAGKNVKMKDNNVT